MKPRHYGLDYQGRYSDEPRHVTGCGWFWLSYLAALCMVLACAVLAVFA